jgi:thymidylate synthase
LKQYLEMLQYILSNGVRKPTRAKLESTGRNIDAISVFGYQNRYNLQEGFPILTTKKIPFKTVAHELIWFLSGDTNVKYLHDNNVHIWDQWVKPDGTIGEGYGKQWRNWQFYKREECEGREGLGGAEIEVEYKLKKVDQISNLIRDIKEVRDNPLASCGRRLILTAWNPPEIPNMALPPCHTLSQFMVTNGKLSCHLYQRSSDAFLGVPFNISSYALLTHILAAVTKLEVGEFVHTFGDLHIYINHIEQVQEQLEREPFTLPTLWVDDVTLRHLSPDLKNVNVNWFKLQNYNHQGVLKGEVAV